MSNKQKWLNIIKLVVFAIKQKWLNITLIVFAILALRVVSISILRQFETLNILSEEIEALENEIKSSSYSPEKIQQIVKDIKLDIDKLPKSQISQDIIQLEKEVNSLPKQIDKEEILSLKKDIVILEEGETKINNAIYAGFIQALGTLFFLTTAYFTYKNMQIAEDKQLTDRFTKAIELLKDEKIEARLGAIYTLERVAKDSPNDHWTVMEVLTAFIREKSNTLHGDQQVSKVSTDIQSAMTILGRRNTANDPIGSKLDLSGTFLREVNLNKANFDNAIFEGADLKKSQLTRTSLIETNFSGADLEGANLSFAHLEKSLLQDVVNFSGVDFSSAYLDLAFLDGADLSDARLFDASMKKTNLTKANLLGIKKEFTLKQFNDAITDHDTIRPASFSQLTTTEE